MKVLKFGGSSVANAENIRKVAAIVRKSVEAGNCIVVLSALQGTTDALIELGRAAERGDESYRERIDAIAKKHYDTIDSLMNGESAKRSREFVGQKAEDLANTCEGCPKCY